MNIAVSCQVAIKYVSKLQAEEEIELVSTSYTIPYF